MEPIVWPISDHLDLHLFQPKEIPNLLEDYLTACREKGLYRVRIIHGKGKGVQKARVRSLLKKNPNVVSFEDAPLEMGSWGATVVKIKPR